MPFKRECDICHKEILHVRRHTNRTHLPWYMSPAFACTTCQYTGDFNDLRRIHSGHGRVEGESLQPWFLLVNGFFLFISRCLGLASLEALLSFVVAENLFPPSSLFLEEEIIFLKEYDQLAGSEPKDHYQASPPSRISELLNGRILTKLLQKLNPEQRESAPLYECYLNLDGSDPQPGHPVFKLHIVDAHFHLDELIGRTGKSFKQLESLSNSSISLIHAIANFVYPGKWGTINALMGMDSRLSFSLGVHPHLLYLSTWENLFVKLERQLRRFPQAIAIGEVGLDFTTTCRCSVAHDRKGCVEGKIQAQRKFLGRTLRLADQLDKPVIIHCRDRGDGLAAKQALEVFVDCNLTHLKVQRHCFVGSSLELDSWNQTLPNCFFSLSRQSTVDLTTREALLMADHRKFLFETDSPYLSFPGDQHHGPWRVGQVTRAVSNLVGVSEAELVRSNNSNVFKLFGIRT